MPTTPSSPANPRQPMVREWTRHRAMGLALAVAIGCALLRCVVFDDTIAEGLGIGAATGIGFLIGLLAFASYRRRPTDG